MYCRSFALRSPTSRTPPLHSRKHITLNTCTERLPGCIARLQDPHAPGPESVSAASLCRIAATRATSTQTFTLNIVKLQVCWHGCTVRFDLSRFGMCVLVVGSLCAMSWPGAHECGNARTGVPWIHSGHVHCFYRLQAPTSADDVNRLWGLVDADYAGCPDTRKSHSGYVLMLNSGAISWKSNRHGTVCLSH